VVKTPIAAKKVNEQLSAAGIVGGYDLGNLGSRFDHHLLLCTTELNDRAGIDALVEVLRG
jgi:glycine cleavage system pyridoxal-binding protein P